MEDKEDKRINIMWSLSLVIIGVVTMIIAGANIMAGGLPPVWIRVFGIIDLIALPFLGFSSVKKICKRK